MSTSGENVDAMRSGIVRVSPAVVTSEMSDAEKTPGKLVLYGTSRDLGLLILSMVELQNSGPYGKTLMPDNTTVYEYPNGNYAVYANKVYRDSPKDNITDSVLGYISMVKIAYSSLVCKCSDSESFDISQIVDPGNVKVLRYGDYKAFVSETISQEHLEDLVYDGVLSENVTPVNSLVAWFAMWLLDETTGYVYPMSMDNEGCRLKISSVTRKVFNNLVDRFQIIMDSIIESEVRFYELASVVHAMDVADVYQYKTFITDFKVFATIPPGYPDPVPDTDRFRRKVLKKLESCTNLDIKELQELETIDLVAVYVSPDVSNVVCALKEQTLAGRNVLPNRIGDSSKWLFHMSMGYEAPFEGIVDSETVGELVRKDTSTESMYFYYSSSGKKIPVALSQSGPLPQEYEDILSEMYHTGRFFNPRTFNIERDTGKILSDPSANYFSFNTEQLSQMVGQLM
jgi:hypothetical protein